jgi:Tfp pilus assembly protein PilV
MNAFLRPLFARLRDERAFGMVELLAAMTVLVVGLLAVFSMFSSGLVSIKRASTVTTAAVIADSEMEKLRAIKYESIGLTNSTVNAADAVYTGDSAYIAVNTASTTLSSAITAAATSLTVGSASGFPGSGSYRIRIDDEALTVTAGAGSTTWTVSRGSDGTLGSAHSSGATVTVVQRIDVPTCGTAPCTTLVPTKNVTGGDNRAYRVDTYATWTGVRTQGGTSGRSVKLITIVVRDQAAPNNVWARVSSTFDESTGL